MSTPLDCQRCGACCCNPEDNRREGFRAYIDVADSDRGLRQRPDLLRKYTVTLDDGTIVMRLLGAEERCAALLGAVGRRVRCAMYAQRPEGCRRVQLGSPECLWHRRQRGLD